MATITMSESRNRTTVCNTDQRNTLDSKWIYILYMHKIYRMCEERHPLNTACVCQDLKDHLKKNQNQQIQTCKKKKPTENSQPKEIHRLEENRAVQGKIFYFK